MNDMNKTIEVSDSASLIDKPLVSVLMITYNHADYLAKAIEGVVSQRCDFSFELIIGEDASEDKSREIALRYQNSYPNIIRVIYSAINVGMNFNGRRIFDRARGEYIAFCEGDDYWCSPYKLARQVNMIQRDKLIGIVHADWVRSKFRKGAWQFDFKKSVHRRVPLRLLQGNLFPTWHFPKILRTCTILLRSEVAREIVASELAQHEYLFGDNVWNAYVTSKWYVAYLPEVVAVYHESMNSALRSGVHSRVAFYKSALKFDTDARAFFRGRANYGDGFRWEVSVALLLWAIRAKDIKSALFSLRDIGRHFSLIHFIKVGCMTIFMRWPTLRRQPRILPDSSI